MATSPAADGDLFPSVHYDSLLELPVHPSTPSRPHPGTPSHSHPLTNDAELNDVFSPLHSQLSLPDSPTPHPHSLSSSAHPSHRHLLPSSSHRHPLSSSSHSSHHHTLPSSGSAHPSRHHPLSSSSPPYLSSSAPLLLTTSVRKGGTLPSRDTQWNNDGSALLESLLPDRHTHVPDCHTHIPNRHAHLPDRHAHLHILVTTWNMMAGKVLPACLDDLLLPLSQEVVADVCVVGTQESTPSRRQWEVLVQQTLGPGHVLVHSSSLGTLHLLLFLRRELLWYCSAVKSASVAVRPGSLINTKGGVALSFSLFGSSMLFISSHLSAHQDRLRERNADVQKIADGLSLGEGGERALETHEHVFWLGDLNYRVEVERERADQCLQRGDWMPLLLEDQLTKEILRGNVFVGFSEQPISFPPTYKFDVDSNCYDSSEKKRIPSWTDRILYRSSYPGGITGCGYESVQITSSDHRPVLGSFRVRIQPSTHLDGVPESLASFDAELYLAAQQRRRELAAQCAALRAGGTPRPQHVASSVCMLL